MEQLGKSVHDCPPVLLVGVGEVVTPFSARDRLFIQYFLDKQAVECYQVRYMSSGGFLEYVNETHVRLAITKVV